ncbi:MAG: MaoC/PaaZ C-terminal domain-containing protein, partial [Elioraea sp.]|nr:MaoC/PaaZ C-terminal domain-containing protein [Elioraea sp.]
MKPVQAINRTYDEITVGDTASEVRTITADDLVLFAHASGNLNPIHLPGKQGEGDDEEAVAPGMLVASLFSSVLGNKLPGPGTLYRRQTVHFAARAKVGDTLTVTMTAKLKLADNVIVFDGRVVNQDGVVIAEGEAEVIAPSKRMTLDDAALPILSLRRQVKFDRLIAACAGLPPLATAVIHPCDQASLAGPMEAAKTGLIV